MRRLGGIILGCGLFLAGGATTTRAQDVTAADPVGFGRAGVSNSLGYGVTTDFGRGYYTGLYRSFDNTTESVYYSPIFSSLNGTPSPKAEANGWGFSPPWAASYRQGGAKKSKGLGLLHRRR